MLHLQVAGTGRDLPEEIIPNSFFTGRDLHKYARDGSIVETKQFTDEGIVKVTGIKERRKALAYESPSDLGYRAAVKAIEASGIDASSLVGIVSATLTEDSDCPSAACKIQKKLGVRNCIAYNVGFACASFPEIMAQVNARNLRRPGNYLVVSMELMTRMTDYTDINSTLFGDGAGAAVLTPTEGPLGIVGEYSNSDPFGDEGNNDELIFRDGRRFIRLPEGKPVMKRATRSMITSAEEAKKQAGWTRAELYIPHQANGRIVSEVEARVKDKGSVVYRNVERFGNMSGATCAIALDECLRDGLIKKSDLSISGSPNGSRVVITSIGGGIVESAVAIQF